MKLYSKCLCTFVIFAGLLVGPAVAQTQQPPETTTVIMADRILDVRTGRMQSGVVIVQGDRITHVGAPPVAGLSNPTIHDFRGQDVTILPGFMDVHTHLAYDISGDWVNRPVRETAADAALRGARNARLTLLAGFTTVRDVGSSDFVDVSLMKAIEAGYIDGPRIFPAGHSLGITGGHCDVTGFAPGILEQDWRHGIADGPDEIVKAVRYQIKHGAKWIKTCATAGVLSFEESVGAQQYSDAELKAMVDEAARHGVKVCAHAHGTEGIKAAIRAGIASIEHGSILDDEAIELFKEYGTYLVPTTYLVDVLDTESLPPGIKEKAEYILPIARDSLARAIRAGVKIAFGTDSAVYPHGDNAKEFEVLVRQGMTPLQAIQSATLNTADLLGVDDRGTLEVGKLADVVVVAGNPLENIRATENVRFVMIGGRVVKNEN